MTLRCIARGVAPHRAAFAVRAAFATAIVVLAIPAGASAATKTVGAGPPVTKPPPGVPEYGDATQFFPKTVTVHAGDSVRWKFFGFHNIYFPKKGGKNISLLVPDPSRIYTGEVDPAGQPFWFNGRRQLVGNPNVAFPRGGKTENGSKATGSGVPQSEHAIYKLTFPKTGTFTYYCSIHAGMTGTVKVVSRRARISSAAADKKAVDKQIAATIAEVKRNDSKPALTGNVIQIGRDTVDSSLLHFFPDKKTVPVGTTLEFRMTPKGNEVHTVTFGTDAVFAKGGYAEKVGEALLAPLPGTGQNGPPVIGVPGAALFPSDPWPLAFDGTQHGGFANTGLLGTDVTKPLPESSKITFTTPGTYNFMCLVHPEMRGTVTVQRPPPIEAASGRRTAAAVGRG